MALCTPNATPVFDGIPSEAGDGPIPGFMELISQWPTAIPNDSIWSVEFEAPTGTLEIDEPLVVGGEWNVNSYARNVSTERVTKEYGGWYKSNMLASSIKLVGESIKTERVGSAGSEGYLRGIVSGGRDDFGTLDVAFIETNHSFVDYIIRPWLISIAKDSLIARGNSKRVNITCTMYGLMGRNNNPVKRKTFVFFNAFPTSVDEEEYNFTESEVNFRKVSFSFTHYAMTSPGANPGMLKCNTV
jgi:hypothetical protein